MCVRTSFKASSNPAGHSCISCSTSGMFLCNHRQTSAPTICLQNSLGVVDICSWLLSMQLTASENKYYKDNKINSFLPDIINPIVHFFHLCLWISNIVYCLKCCVEGKGKVAHDNINDMIIPLV